jgi:hypothetical protein
MVLAGAFVAILNGGLFHWARSSHWSKSERNQITTASDILRRFGARPSDTSFKNVDLAIPQYDAASLARSARGSCVSFAIVVSSVNDYRDI